MTVPTDPSVTDRQPHPFVGGRAAALRALADWRAGTGPGAVLVTGSPGSGRSRLLTGFLMLCEPGFRDRIELAVLDPATVPPEGLPAPQVFGAAGLTASQLLWLVADELVAGADRSEDVHRRLAEAGPMAVPVVIADCDRAGVLPGGGEVARVTTEVLLPLVLAPGVRLLAEVPRAEAERLAKEVPGGHLLVVDLDQDPWRDPAALLLQAEHSLEQPGAAGRLAQVADNALVVRLAAWSARAVPGAPLGLPGGVGDALDLHAERCGTDELTLRRLLAPLALAGPDAALPLELWAPLASAVAGKDLGPVLAAGQQLLLPFVELAGDEQHPEVRIVHPAVADELRERFGGAVREVQRRIATALLATVRGEGPERWRDAVPYVREQLAGHALEGGLLAGLLAEPGFLLHAEQLRLRAAVEELVATGGELPPIARTWLRLAPLFTRQGLRPELRAGLLEHGARQDGVEVPELGVGLPWNTLWTRPLPGVRAVTASVGPDGRSALVAYRPDPGPGAEGIPGLTAFDALTGEQLVVDPDALVRPSEEQRAAVGLALSTGEDYLRVWAVQEGGVTGDPVAVFLSAGPLGGADLTPDGLVLLADATGVSVLRLAAAAA
ncbi:ATP-binding protein [Kitasatospora sp. NPDC002040]|uniref:ATP-binding protein n=1 Tax=Kitasatospora sp. NPDC002040 TaxID=3154661 RepID=UPI0033307ADD